MNFGVNMQGQHGSPWLTTVQQLTKIPTEILLSYLGTSRSIHLVMGPNRVLISKFLEFMDLCDPFHKVSQCIIGIGFGPSLFVASFIPLSTGEDLLCWPVLAICVGPKTLSALSNISPKRHQTNLPGPNQRVTPCSHFFATFGRQRSS